MSTGNLLLLLAVGVAGYFGYKALSSGQFAPPATSPGPGMAWAWNGFQWVASQPGAINL